MESLVFNKHGPETKGDDGKQWTSVGRPFLAEDIREGSEIW